ncbi:amidohydrolase family protein [Novosphingobium sp. G106]|uniref:N-acyl-D-amino-acid deacylase family protein n=1 Tax=Novosphingobium sp. G106 TaxID=2849500 RepID=UPI001C2D4697|nr:amidohydrolase family protein [Novosphingobium sp. G106]MBV1689718.1 amidohydrolase family protein [Novosphingobium sp. G106]
MSEPDFDIVIRGGTVVDGSGGEPFVGDVAIRGRTVAGVGAISGRGREEIDATGRIVTPGFVDIHTHYDGQITWENRLAPSSGHGVTTVVMGNCGVGFAPARPDQRELMIKMMEGVEDVPEAVMSEGLPWNWETFPDYLDAIEQRHADIDFAAQLPHNPLRVYVMGQRGADCEPPTSEDLEQMRELTAEAIRAGAIGVSTTRNLAHRYRDGRNVPTITSEVAELTALAEGLRDAGGGVFEILGDDRLSGEETVALLRGLVETSGRPLSFTLTQPGNGSDRWLVILDGIAQASADGLPIKAQVMPRPVGILIGLDLSLHPFAFHPSFAAIAHLPLAEKVAAMRDPELRRRLMSEQSDDPHAFFKAVADDTDWLFPLGDPPNYHPAMEDSIAARARRAGLDPREVIYDALLEDEGRAVLYRPSANRIGERFEGAGQVFLKDPNVLLGLSDGGAHYGMICDAALPTYFLTHWAAHPDPAKRVDLPRAIRMLASDTAEAVGLRDRGRIAAGLKADINVIDLDRLQLHAPRPVYDLPAGGRRLMQAADGYDATIVSGEVTYRAGKPTGALPGRLVRGAR